MRILTIHADYLKFQPVKGALKEAEKTEKKPIIVKECLVVFTAVEKRDERNLEKVTKKYVEEIKEILQQIKVKNIVLYPYAHLSPDLALPAKARKVLEEAEKLLKEENYQITRAPFGWYKSFEISCKGHPLSELSREFSCEEKEEISTALKAEKKLISHWFILSLKGELSPLEKKDDSLIGFDFSQHKNLEKFAKYEISKVRAVSQEPAHVKYMKKLALVDYEPSSDPGNLRYYPKGRMIKALLEQFVTEKVLEYGGLEVETPIMYDYQHPALRNYLNRFPARQYTIKTPNKEVFLRFAACFGQFLIAHDSQISYKDLPLRLYELTHYSFRVEQHGELTGLRRLRAFTMPDCHALVSDLEEAKEEIIKRFELGYNLQKAIGFDLPHDFELAIRITKDFYQKNKDFILKLVKKWGKPALLEIWDEQFFYFIFKYEFNFVDSLEKASALNTDQIDVGNAGNYGIYFINKEGKKEPLIILHLSPSGAIERVIYALLEKAYFMEKAGQAPGLPLWLSPTQVRLIPVSVEKHLEWAEKLMAELEKEKIRADLDDRIESISKRIREAEMEWIPFSLVIGDKEMKGKELIVRDRKQGKEIKMTKEELIKKIKKEVKDKPFRPLPLPKHLSRRPIFG